MSKHTFGVFTDSQQNVTFRRVGALVGDLSSPFNSPTDPNSPNYPRAEGRIKGFPNPILGDEGFGRIGRWHVLKIDALSNVVEQVIEQFLRDKSWYATVRCRESLWNMYRRIAWWVNNQVDPQKNDYQRVLVMMQDCIKQILDNDTCEGEDLPVCPAPYPFTATIDYFNDFDGGAYEQVLLSTKNMPLMADFPPHFRWVSSIESQEWELVRSVSANEQQGNENIMKFSLDRLLVDNSTKICHYRRFKHGGYVRFKVLASVEQGNGLYLFINENQVGGEWCKSSAWQEYQFAVAPGQVFKFDWLLRKKTEREWGRNAVYVKDVEFVEVIPSQTVPAPPDVDTLGTMAYFHPHFDWVKHSRQGIVKAPINGHWRSFPTMERRLVFPITTEANGEVSFAYSMGVDEPWERYHLFFHDSLRDTQELSISGRGNRVLRTVGTGWSMSEWGFVTNNDGATATWDIEVSPQAKIAWFWVYAQIDRIFADDSHILFDLRDEGGNVVYQSSFAWEGGQSFVVTDLTHLPYSKYRATLTTVQRGGAVFKLHTSAAVESWLPVPNPFDSTLRFFINGQLQGAFSTEGTGFTASYPLPRGHNVLEWVFTGESVGENWDYAAIDWIRATNWMVDTVTLVPYCEPMGGDRCVEALIKCLLGILKRRPKAVTIGKRMWLLT